MTSAGVNIRVSNLQKSWGDVEVLDNISFDVAAGTFLTLLGPSGCGKSTALRLIAGLDEVSGGTISIEGRDVTGFAPAQRNIGMVFQNYALFPHMNVRKNILYGMRIRRTPIETQNRNLARVTELMGLDMLLERYPAQLSGGQQQRVALARVLVAERPLVLMDEPLSNLDAKLRVEIRSEIRALNKTLGITVIYVTHDQSEALSMSDKILLMKDGRTSQFGTPVELYKDPQNTFAASFIGTPPVNLIPADMLDPQLLESYSRAAADIQVGIRPEDFSISEKATKSGLRGTVVGTEYEGVQTLLTIDIAGRANVITSTVGANTIAIGTEVFLDFDPETLHVFAKEDGEKIHRNP